MRLSLFAAIRRWLAPVRPARRAGWIGKHVFAHRGLHGQGVTENSASAFRAALERGLGIECDIQRSLDDCPMVFHDWDLKRLVGIDAETGSMAAGELKSLCFTGADEGPITLADLLVIVAGQVPLLIEIKSRHGYDVESTCNSVYEALKGYRGLHAVMSFDPRVPCWFADNAASTVRGLVVTEENEIGAWGDIRREAAFRHAQPDFLAYDVRDLPSAFADAKRKKGFPVATWTVRTPELLERARRYADAPIAECSGLEPVT